MIAVMSAAATIHQRSRSVVTVGVGFMLAKRSNGGATAIALASPGMACDSPSAILGVPRLVTKNGTVR
jgi:hypothetical protein